MKQLLLLALLSIFCFPLMATTLPKSLDPVVISINLPKEQVWQRVLDLFVANSIPIKLMDKSSGLIQSDRVGLGSHYALKHTNDSTAWALCETIKSLEGKDFYLFPQVINTELQVYIRETADGKVLLSLNLMNMMAASHDPNAGSVRDFAIESTKKLENIIGNYLQTAESMPRLAFDPPLATFGEAPSQVKKREALTAVQLVQKKAQEKEAEAAKTTGTVIGIIVLTILILIGVNSKSDE